MKKKQKFFDVWREDPKWIRIIRYITFINFFIILIFGVTMTLWAPTTPDCINSYNFSMMGYKPNYYIPPFIAYGFFFIFGISAVLVIFLWIYHIIASLLGKYDSI